MEKIEKKLKNYLAITSGMTVAMVVLGLIFIFLPGLSLDVIRWVITACLIAAGLFTLISYSSFSGVIILIVGAVVGLYPDLVNIVPVILGVYVILSSALKIGNLNSLKNASQSAYVVAMILSIVGIICGLVMIAHPGATTEILMRIIGVVMLVYGIADFTDVMIMRHYLDSFTARTKSKKSTKKTTRVSDIAEGKVVRKK